MRTMTAADVPPGAQPLDALGRRLIATAGHRAPCGHWAPRSAYTAQACPVCDAGFDPADVTDEVAWTVAPVQDGERVWVGVDVAGPDDATAIVPLPLEATP